MSKPVEKARALKLRQGGESIRSIAKKVGVSKATVSLWCENIQLTVAQETKLKQNQISAGHRGRILGAEMNRTQRLDRIAHHAHTGKEQIRSLSNRDLLMLGLGLYWGEGAKSRTGPASLVNSDAALLLVAKQWFQECLGVLPEDFRPYIFISESHRDREQEILRYWAAVLDVPRQQFHKVIFMKTAQKKFYKNRNSYYGVVALRIRKGTDLKYRIQGLIDACKHMPG